MGRNLLKLDVRGFDEYIAKLEDLDAAIPKIVEDALNQAGETITEDTIDAIAEPNLPRGGQYSSGETKESILENPHTQWVGSVAEIGVGFDFSKPGAGGYLITGTPRMAPDRELNAIYKKKKYMDNIKKDMIDVFEGEIKDRMGG